MAGRCTFCRGPTGKEAARGYAAMFAKLIAHCSGTHNPKACWVWQGAKRHAVENGEAPYPSPSWPRPIASRCARTTLIFNN